jgi:hypothetical protein
MSAGLAFCTVPAECLAVHRILSSLNGEVPPSYASLAKQLGIRKLFAGTPSRISYVLAGNFGTLLGMEIFGSDLRGFSYTSIAKGALLPLSLLANARAKQMSWAETRSFVSKGSLNPGCHISFFSRNLISNYCLLPAFYARDYCYEVLEEKSTTIPNIVGHSVASILSGTMNTFTKPFYTGKYPTAIRWPVAKRLTALPVIIARESVSLGVIFGNSSPRSRSAGRRDLPGEVLLQSNPE